MSSAQLLGAIANWKTPPNILPAGMGVLCVCLGEMVFYLLCVDSENDEVQCSWDWFGQTVHIIRLCHWDKVLGMKGQSHTKHYIYSNINHLQICLCPEFYSSLLLFYVQGFLPCVCAGIILKYFLCEARHLTSAINEDIETRGSNCIRITDDCAFVAVRWAVNVCVWMCSCYCVTDRRLKDDCVFRRQSRFAGCLWKDQGEIHVKKRC